MKQFEITPINPSELQNKLSEAREEERLSFDQYVEKRNYVELLEDMVIEQSKKELNAKFGGML